MEWGEWLVLLGRREKTVNIRMFVTAPLSQFTKCRPLRAHLILTPPAAASIQTNAPRRRTLHSRQLLCCRRNAHGRSVLQQRHHPRFVGHGNVSWDVPYHPCNGIRGTVLNTLVVRMICHSIGYCFDAPIRRNSVSIFDCEFVATRAQTNSKKHTGEYGSGRAVIKQ